MTVLGLSAWWLLGAIAVMLTGGLLLAWLAQEWAPRRPHRRLNDGWPGELADGGPIDQRQREELLAGVSALEEPAVIKSVERARRRGRLGRRGQR